MPKMNGLDACAAIHRDYPEIRVVIVTGLSDDSLPERARQAGASAFVQKHLLALDLLPAIRQAIAA
jgi:DNA-binding NarL/FixJ family response regulator